MKSLINDDVKQLRETNKQIDNIRFLPHQNKEQLLELERLQTIQKQMLLNIGRKHK
jgi:hypothetical protein